MKEHKNAILIIISVILLIYAGFISIFPALLTKSFNLEQFEQKIYDATSLVTKVGSIEYKIKPNLDMVITLRNWSSKYVDDQDCFDARYIELTTTPFAIFNGQYNIKDLYLKNVKYSGQTLPDGNDKLAFLPGAFNSELFGHNNIVIVPGPVRIKNYTNIHIWPNTSKEDTQENVSYSKEEVKSFLSQFTFSHVIIK